MAVDDHVSYTIKLTEKKGIIDAPHRTPLKPASTLAFQCIIVDKIVLLLHGFPSAP